MREKTKHCNNLKLKGLLLVRSISFQCVDFLWNNFYKTQVGRSVIKIVFTSICVRNWKQTFLVDLFSLSAPKCFYVSWEGDPIFIFCIFCIFYFYSLNINILFMERNSDFSCKAVDRGFTWTFVSYNYPLICCYCYLVFWCQDNIHYNVMFM